MTANNSSEILEKKIINKIGEMEFRTKTKIDEMEKKLIIRIRIFQFLIIASLALFFISILI
jgi:hypothetical protein